MKYSIGVCLILLAISGNAAESRRIDEIVVTAEHVKKSAQDTPIGISVFDDKFIEDAGFTEIDDLAMYVPSMSRDTLDLTIRGIGRNFRSLGGDVGVPTYFNGIYTEEAIALGSEQAYYDIQRVEVLRGPQGTLYGRNAIGGVVNYITHMPTSEFFAEIKTRAGAYDTSDIHGVISGPLISNVLNFRLVGVSTNQGPDRTSRAAPGQRPLSDTGGYEDNNLALTLEFTPTDNLHITVRGVDRYFRLTPRVPVLLGEGETSRQTRSGAVCFPEGTDCYQEPSYGSVPTLNPSANSSLPVNGNGFGEDLDNIAYPDFKPDYGYWYTNASVDAQWRFGYDRFVLRYLGGYSDVPGTVYRRHDRSATGGRNTCVPPLCTVGSGGNQISAYAAHGENPLRQQTHEMQLISTLGGGVEFVAGLFYADFERELHYELADSAQLGAYTVNPSWGLLDPAQFFPDPIGIARHDVGLNDEARFAYFGGTNRGTFYWFDSELNTRAKAIYLQLNLDLTDTLQLTVGGRWSEDTKHGREWRWAFTEFDSTIFGYSLEEFNQLITTDPTTGGYNGDPYRLTGFPVEIVDSVDIKDEWQQPTWRLALSWKPNETTLAYGSMTTGYRSGGFNLGVHQLFPYDEEHVLAYEAGIKTDLFDNTLRLNLNAFFYDYEDHQISANQFLPQDQTGCVFVCGAEGSTSFLTNAVRNVSEAESWGLETEIIWRAIAQLSIGAIHSYLDTEITSDFIISRLDNEWSSFSSDADVNLKGAELVRSPAHKATGWANYTMPLGDHGTLNFLTSYAYTGKQYYNVLNDRINEAPSYTRWDFRVTWDSPTEKYRITAYAKNIANELGVIQLRAGQNFVRTADTTRPRSWGIEFRMRFGAWSQNNGRSLLFDGPNAQR